MLDGILSVTLPPLLVFGLYHLMTWFNVFRINGRRYWKRVALVSVCAHVLLVSGFFIFSWFDYQANQRMAASDVDYGVYLFRNSEFLPLMKVFETAPMLCLLALAVLLQKLAVPGPALVALTIVITYAVGGVQWYFVGGGIGALFERFWEGLKTNDDEDEWFQ